MPLRRSDPDFSYGDAFNEESTSPPHCEDFIRKEFYFQLAVIFIRPQNTCSFCEHCHKRHSIYVSGIEAAHNPRSLK